MKNCSQRLTPTQSDSTGFPTENHFLSFPHLKEEISFLSTEELKDEVKKSWLNISTERPVQYHSWY